MSNRKHEWRKQEREWYNPPAEPQEVTVPAFGYFVIEGRGDPNGPEFAANVERLYTLAYGVRMSAKAGLALPGFFEYTVYPLEGLWDLAVVPEVPGVFRKEDLVYRLMIRQPDFVDAAAAQSVTDRALKKKPCDGLEAVRFEVLNDGRSVQMLHEGSFDTEAASFRRMEDFCRKESLARVGHVHREIYVSDPRRTEPDKLTTVLRFPVRDHFACE